MSGDETVGKDVVVHILTSLIGLASLGRVQWLC